MNPEMISMIEQLLAQAKGSQGGSQSASGGGDYDAICAKVKADLEPMVTMIGQKLEESEKRVAEIEDIIGKMLTSFSDAVGNYKMQGLRSSLSEKFGPDLESIAPFYKDAYDSDITEDLLQALSGYDGDPMEMAGESIGNLKAKFGKYRMEEPKVEAEVTVEKPEDDSQGKLDLEPKAEEPPQEDTDKKIDIEPFDKLKADMRKRMGM